MSITTSTKRMTAKEEMIFELGKKRGFHWGINYFKTIVEQNTYISELYGWQSILNDAYDRTMELVNKIPDVDEASKVGYMGTTGTEMEDHDF